MRAQTKTKESASLVKANLVKDYQRNTTGTENHYLHWDRRFKYTDGVKYVADTCAAHWLIDAIASHQPQINRNFADYKHFQCWQIAFNPLKDNYLLICWGDAPNASSVLARQIIEYTDFPAELMPFKLLVESGVLLLPEEH